MSTHNHNWFNAQEGRHYPLDDNATGTGDDGTRLKDDIIVDLHLRWPLLVGEFAFVGGITVTENIVTVVILAADTVDSAADFTPLAAVTIPQPVNRYQYYTVEPLYPGVGGFIAFGDVEEPFSIRFAAPKQGLLAPKTARAYAALPIPTMRKLGRVDGLTGIVKIVGGTDIDIVKESVVVAGEEHDAMVVRLVNPTTARNVLSDYIGPCGVRPESQNCAKLGVETINGIGPDCAGNIELAFAGLTVGPYGLTGADVAGVTLDQAFGIDDVCVASTIGRFTGIDACAPSSSESASSSSSSASFASSASLPGVSSSSAAIPCEDIPYLDCFHSLPLHTSWDLKIGGFSHSTVYTHPGEPINCNLITSASSGSSVSSTSAAAAPSASSASSGASTASSAAIPTIGALLLDDTSRRNVITWDDCGYEDASVDKTITTHVQLTNQGPRINAGIVLNYHTVDPLTAPHVEYFVAQINRSDNKIELLRYNGTSLVVENSVTPGLPFALGDWYEIEVTATTSGGQVNIVVTVRDDSNPAWPTVSFSLLTSQWGNNNGFHGLTTNRSVAIFSHWEIIDA